jgi:hypothetical protein
MIAAATTQRFWPALPRLFSVFRSVPAWAALAFCLAVTVSFSPNLLTIYGIHNDYEMLAFKSRTFLHPEAEELLSIARPVAALMTNLPMLPVETLQDYRWTRLFSLLTLWLMGIQLMSICVHRLRTRAWDALAIALATFLGLPFIYSVLNATAWPPHLFSILLAVSAYAILSRVNVLTLSLLDSPGRCDYRLLLLQAWEYVKLKPVWLSCIVLQVAFYDYPPNALILTLFPIVGVLFSRSAPVYRAVIAVRDIVFIGVNMVIFAMTAKLIYLPFVRLFTSLGNGAVPENADPLVARLRATYQFAFNFDPLAAWHRLVNVLKVTGDLWFLPQFQAHLVVGFAVLLAVALVNIGAFAERRRLVTSAAVGDWSLSRLVIDLRRLPAIITLGVPVICFLIAASAILASAAGFVTYRTIAISSALVAVVALFAVRGIVDALWRMIGNPFAASGRIADVAMGLLVGTAVAANFYANDLTLRLARNEFAYFTAVVRHAAQLNSTVIVIVDPRPVALPEDIPVVYDQRGRAVPPYELGCLSGFCLQTGAIIQIAARQLGYPADRFKVYLTRAGDPIPGLTCDMLTDPNATLPPRLSELEQSTLDWFRSMAFMTCMTYTLHWHDVGIDLTRPAD